MKVSSCQRLIWKEFHELKWWGAALTAGCTLLTLAGAPADSRIVEAPFLWLWLVFGWLVGATGYSRELSWDTVRFLYSRPVRWWHLWLVKFGVSAALFLTAAVVSTVVYRLVCPAYYLPFASLNAVFSAFMLSAGVFSCGFAVSGVLPGLSLTFCVSAAAAAATSATILIAEDELKRDVQGAIPIVVVIGTLVAVSVSVSRSLTDSVNARVKRFARIVTIGLVLLLVGLLPFARRPDVSKTELSPDRNLIAVVKILHDRDGDRNTLSVKQVGAKRTHVVDRGHILSLGWSPDSRRFLYILKSKNEIALKQIEATSRRAERLVVFTSPSHIAALEWRTEDNAAQWSPDGNRMLIAVVLSQKFGLSQDELLVFDFRARALLRVPKENWEPGDWTWTNDHEVVRYNALHYAPGDYATRSAALEIASFDVQTATLDRRTVRDEAMPVLHAHPRNLDFETSPFYPIPDWNDSADPHSSRYFIYAYRAIVHGGRISATIQRQPGVVAGAVRYSQTIAADAYRGRRVRLTGYLRSEGITEGFAGLWLRSWNKPDDDDPTHERLTAADSGVRGTSDWRRLELDLDIGREARALAFGSVLRGNGKVWADDFKLDVVGRNR